MVLPKPTLKLLHCPRDRSQIKKVLSCLGIRSEGRLEGEELVILFVKKPFARVPMKKAASRKKKRARR
jgi:hypothetical protein